MALHSTIVNGMNKEVESLVIMHVAKMLDDEVYLMEIFEVYVTFIKRWMLIVGVWPIDKPSLAYRFVGICSIVCNLTMTIEACAFAYIHLTNLGVVVKVISGVTSLVTSSMKGFLLLYYKQDILQVYKTLKNYHLKSLKDDNLRYAVVQVVLPFRQIQQLQTFMSSISITVYIIAPLLSILHQFLTHAEPIEYSIPVPILVPWHINPPGISYVLTYLYEVYNLTVLLSLTCGVDAFFALIVVYVIGQLRVMSYKIENVADNDYYNVVRQCVTEYIILKKCCATLQDVYGPVILWMIITNSITICTVFFQLSQISDVSVPRYILIICYIGTKIIQTYAYAFSGTALTTKSEEFFDAIYFSNWPSYGSQRFRTSVLMMLGQKPLDVTIIKFILVSMDTFVTTMNSAVSYFFLLKTLEGKSS